MHKNLNKDLYSKRNKKKYYPPVNDISISPSNNVNYQIQENVKKDTVSEEYPRSLKSNREKWIEKYGKHLHPQSNKNFASKF